MQKSDFEQNGLLFTTDTSRPKSKRRSSILKVRQPSLDLDDCENTAERKLRRVSFSESHEVWEFQAHHLGTPFMDARNTEEAEANLSNSSNFLCASDKKNILDVLSFGAKKMAAYGTATTDVSVQSKTVAALNDSQDIFTSLELPKKNGAGNRTFYDGNDMDVTKCLTSAINLNSSLWKPDESVEDVLNSHEPHQTYSTINRTIYDDVDMDMTECLTEVVALGASSVAHHNIACNLANMSSLVEDSEVVFNSCEPHQRNCEGHRTVCDGDIMDMTNCLTVVTDQNSLEISSDLLEHKDLSGMDKMKSIQGGSADVSLTECGGKLLGSDASFKNPGQTIIFSKLEGEVEETTCIEPKLQVFTNWNTMDTEVFSESAIAKLNDPESDADGITSKNNIEAASVIRNCNNVLYTKENGTNTLMPMHDYNGILPSCSFIPEYVTDSEILTHKQATTKSERKAANVAVDFCKTTKLNISKVTQGQVSDVLGISKPSKCCFEESNKENVVGSCVNVEVDSQADRLFGKSKQVAKQQELPFVNAASKQASLQCSAYSTIFPSSYSLPSSISVCEKSCSKPDKRVVNTTEICGTAESNISNVDQSQISGIIGERDASETRKLRFEKNDEDGDYPAERQFVCQPEAVSVSKSKDMTTGRYLSPVNMIPTEILTQNSMHNTILPCGSFLPENVKEFEILRNETSFALMDIGVFSDLCQSSKIGISSIAPDLPDYSGIVSVNDDTCKHHFDQNSEACTEDSVVNLPAIPELKDISFISAEELMEQSELPVMNVTSSEVSAKNILHYSLFLCDPALCENVPECKILDDEKLCRRQDQTGVSIAADFCRTSGLNVSDNGHSHMSGIVDVHSTSKTCENLFKKSNEGFVSKKLVSSEPEAILATNPFGLSNEPEVPAMNEIPTEPRSQEAFNNTCDQAARLIGSVDVPKTSMQLPKENNPDYTEDSTETKPTISEPENNLVSHSEDLTGQPELPTESVIEKKSPLQNNHVSKLAPAFSSERQNGEIKLMSPFLVSAISDKDTFEGNAPPMPITQLAATKSCDLKNANNADDCDLATEEFRQINEEAFFLLRVRKVLKETLLRSLNHFLSQLPNRRENDRIVTWNVEDWDDFGCRITFLSRTLVLNVTFGGIIEDLEFCGRAAQKIKNVVLQSLLGGPMWPECELAHRLMHEVIDVSHLRCFKDTSQIDMVLHHILVSIFQAECVKKDICQLDPLHYRHVVAIRGHRLNVKYMHPVSFTISCDVHLPQLHLIRPEWKVTLRTCEVGEDDILDQISRCNPGFHYLDDVFHQIRDWLKTLPLSSQSQFK